MQFLNLVSIPQLAEDQSKDCEFILSEKDLLLVLNSMPNNKSPGNDGLTKAFYEVFWEDDQFCIYNSWNREYLNIEHSKAIIDKTKRIDEEISKHGLKKDKYLMKWRPFTDRHFDFVRAVQWLRAAYTMVYT